MAASSPDTGATLPHGSSRRDAAGLDGEAARLSWALTGQSVGQSVHGTSTASEGSTAECAGGSRRDSKDTAPEHESLATTALPSPSADPTTNAIGAFGAAFADGWNFLVAGALFRPKTPAAANPTSMGGAAKAQQRQPTAKSPQQHASYGHDPLSRVQTAPESLW